MNESSGASKALPPVDPKIQSDWDEIEARRAEINSREGGDTRRRAILRRLGMFKQAS